MKHAVPVLVALIAAAGAARAEPVTFEPAEIVGWEREVFSGETRYEAVEHRDRSAVRAVCDDTASGLFSERRIDLAATPILEWSWAVSGTFGPETDERTKAGDDFPARIYVVDERGILPWEMRALVYVWAGQAPVGADWPNPYAEEAHMIAVDSGKPMPAGGWVTVRRDVRADFARFAGIDVDAIDGLAIMTDCDDRDAMTEAWYGPVRFLPAE